MRLNQLVFLVASTVLVGAVVGFATAAAGMVHVVWYRGLTEGAFLATTSLMGFWAFLTLNFVARISLPRRVWRWAQALFLLLALFDMLWYRYRLETLVHSGVSAPYSIYLVQGLWPFLVALVGAAAKRRLSGAGSFIPTAFYLYVFTIIDWLLVIKSQANAAIVNQTGLVMMACNLYMILIFGKLLSGGSPSRTEPTQSQTVHPRTYPSTHLTPSEER
ncbi:MAG: KinB-signaling pathway activation protein [Alicyclobacillus herbarius]|uniref:KinB-signaling pathway activation protein n=1 Tax=Alicyclobacillus herbarius TaxID=122960 RepID=UPI0023559BBA|nr:KinB-signaling pathway activation protein [Alicyclobacillus herbarius]MCL6633488.1 KinB-signaling pathway activation protein [Alicyclobacillus herbarius]